FTGTPDALSSGLESARALAPRRDGECSAARGFSLRVNHGCAEDSRDGDYLGNGERPARTLYGSYRIFLLRRSARLERGDSHDGHARSSCKFNVGGGIVADSCASLEYDESLVKARSLLHALGVKG